MTGAVAVALSSFGFSGFTELLALWEKDKTAVSKKTKET